MMISRLLPALALLLLAPTTACTEEPTKPDITPADAEVTEVLVVLNKSDNTELSCEL